MERYAEYKDSAVPAFGSIPMQWGEAQLKFFCSMQSGEALTSADIMEDGDYPVYGGNGFRGFYDSFNTEGEYNLVGRQGALCGNVHFVRGRFWATDHAVVTYPSKKVDNKFLYYLLIEMDLNQYSQTAAQPGLSVVTVLKQKALIPEFAEQAAIAAYLDRRTAEIDGLLADLARQAEMLDAYKRQLIAETVTKGIDKSAAMKDSGVDWIGEVPAHWDITPLRGFLKVVSVKNNADLPLLSVEREKGVVDREMEGSENNHNRIPEDLSNYKVVRAGQFVMNKMKAWRGSYGVSNYDGIVSPAYYVFSLNFQNPAFFNYAIRSTKYIGFFGRDSYGIRTDQWDFKIGAIKDIPLAVPPVEEQQAIVDYLDSKIPLIEGLITDITAQIEKLKQYRQIVIHDAVTGKIKVTEG